MRPGGVLAPVPTPIDSTDRVRPDWLRQAFPRWLSSPLTGFVVLGSNGEAALLDDDESDLILGAAREVVPAGRLLIAGTGRESTQATVAATRRAAAMGVDMVLVRTPGFFKSQMTSEVFVRHYRTVADASPVPVLLYNFTAVTGVNLPPAAVSLLSKHPNIVGMKESGGDLSQIGDVIAGTGDGFAVFAGSSGTFYASLCAGVAGGILALAGVMPSACVHLYDLVRQQEHDKARALQRRLLPLGKLLGNGGVAALKAALALQGYQVGVPRAPLSVMNQSGIDALQTALAQLEEVTA